MPPNYIYINRSIQFKKRENVFDREEASKESSIQYLKNKNEPESPLVS